MLELWTSGTLTAPIKDAKGGTSLCDAVRKLRKVNKKWQSSTCQQQVPNADALSRTPCPEECKHSNRVEEKDVALHRTTAVADQWELDQMREDHKCNPELGLLLKCKKTDRRPSWEEVAKYSPGVKALWAQCDSITLDDGTLKRVLKGPDCQEVRQQLLIPTTKRPRCAG